MAKRPKLLQQPQPQTTLLNPDFENALHDWTQGGTLAVVTTSPVYQGVYAAQSTVDDVAAGYWSQLFQEISYGASQPLHFKAQVKTTLAVTSQAKAGVLVEFFDAAKNKVGEVKNEVGGTQDWQPVEVFATTPAATSSVRVSVSLWTPAGDSASLGGTATFDTCVLDDATQPPPPPVSLGLSNPNFEQGLVDWLPNGEPFTTTGASGFHYDDPPLNPGKLAATTRVNSVASDFWSAIYQERSVAAGDPVYASARFRITLSPLAQAKAGVLLQFLDANQAIVGEFKREIGGTQGWRIVQTAGTAPPTATLVRYYLYLFAPQDDTLAVGGEAFYDRCLLEQSTRQPPPQIRPYNLGFKNGLYDWLVTVPSGGRQPPQVSATVFRSGGFLHARSLSGIYAATDTIEPDLSGYWSAVFQEINAPTWPFFYGRVFIQTENLDQGEAGLLLQYLDQNNQIIIEEKRGVTGTLPWTLVEITTQPPAGAVKLRYSCYLYGSSLATGGTAYFDDAHYMVGYTADDVGPFW